VNANVSVQPESLGRFRLASPRTARVLGVATLLSMVAAVPLTILTPSSFPAGIFLIPFAVVGAVVARRQPWNPLGSVLLLLTLAVVGASDAGQYAVLAYHRGYHLPLARLGVVLAPGVWMWLIVFVPLPIALFPDGRLSRGWRSLLRGYLALCVVLVITVEWQNASGAFASHIQIDGGGQLASNDSGGSGISGDLILLLYLALGLAWVLRLLLSYRRSTGDYRQQLKWLLTGGGFGVGGLVVTVSSNGSQSTLFNVAGGIGLLVALIAIPVALGVGILKYRLYEIDRLISRTLSYLILTGLLVGVFVGIVVLATDVLPFSSPVGVAASTLAAAALFNPLRLRVQRLVDRRFNRSRYDAEAIVAAFTLRLRDAVDLDTVRGELLRAVNGAVQPAHASVWIRPPTQRSRA
jgi:hypothetical protein